MDNPHTTQRLEMQLQPDSSACLVTALAMCLGVPVLEVIDAIGHDGREIIRPDLEGGRKFRGFHVQELIRYCLLYKKVDPVYFELIPMLEGPGDQWIEIKYDPGFIHNYLLNRPCVLMGEIDERHHAAAWCPVRQKCLDPEGVMYNLEDFEIWFILRC